MEARIVLLRTHQKNMDRYEGLLETKLSEVERQYIALSDCDAGERPKALLNRAGYDFVRLWIFAFLKGRREKGPSKENEVGDPVSHVTGSLGNPDDGLPN